MQRYNFFFRQKVTESELDAAFDACEQTEFNTHLAQGIIGIQANAVATENSGTPNLTIDISGPAEIRDQLGQRIHWTPTQDVDVSVDENGNSTTVGAAGNQKWISIFAEFQRVLADPRTDGAGVPLQYNSAESFKINVVQGAEAPLGTAARPALRGDQILLTDLSLTFGQTQVLNANFITDRRQDAFVINGGVVRAGTAEAAIENLSTAFALDDLMHISVGEIVTGEKSMRAKIRLDDAGAFIDATALKATGSSDPIFRDLVRAPSGSAGSLVLVRIAEFLSAETDGVNVARVRRFVHPNGGYLVTFNADFDNDSHLFTADANLSAYSYMYAGMQVSVAETIRFVQRRAVAAAGETWDDTSWSAVVIGEGYVDNGGAFFTGGTAVIGDGRLLFDSPTALGSNPTALANPGTNALYAKNIMKVWAKIEINAGVVTLTGRDAFGVASVVASAPNFIVNYHNNFQNLEYAIVPAPFFEPTLVAVLMFRPVSTAAGSTTFEIRRADTGAAVSIASVFAFCNLMCFGEQL